MGKWCPQKGTVMNYYIMAACVQPNGAWVEHQRYYETYNDAVKALDIVNPNWPNGIRRGCVIQIWKILEVSAGTHRMVMHTRHMDHLNDVRNSDFGRR